LKLSWPTDLRRGFRPIKWGTPPGMAEVSGAAEQASFNDHVGVLDRKNPNRGCYEEHNSADSADKTDTKQFLPGRCRRDDRHESEL
jgi:hypothetical protein